MDVIVRNFEAGERDWTLADVNAARIKLLGRRGSTWKRKPSPAAPDGVCVVAVFADDEWQCDPPDREEVILGEGASWAEAFANARGTVAKGIAFHVRRDGAVGWFDLSKIDITAARLVSA